VAEKLDAPVREVCIQNMGPMRSIAALQPLQHEGPASSSPRPPQCCPAEPALSRWVRM